MKAFGVLALLILSGCLNIGSPSNVPVNVENDTAASIAADATATHDGAVIVHLQGGVAEGQKQTIGHLSGPGGSYNLTASAAGLRHSEMVNLNAGTLIWNIIVREDHIEFSFSPL